jgi:hypothetical protein
MLQVVRTIKTILGRPGTFEKLQKVFGNFPIAETPEELAKIQARRMGGGCTGDDDGAGEQRQRKRFYAMRNISR